MATLVVACGALIGAACSGGDDDGVTASPSSAAEAPAETTPPSTSDPTTTAATSIPETTEPTSMTTPATTQVPTTTTPERDGSREHPFDLRADATGGPDLLESDLLETLVALGPVDVDFAAIEAANQFNDPPPAGQHYVSLTMLGTVDAEVEGTVSGMDVLCDLVGDRGVIYEPEFITDGAGTLSLLMDHPDVLSGGSIGGTVIYLVHDEDANFRVYCDGTFIIPG